MSMAVITCHFNPCRYKAPERNFEAFMAHAKAQGVQPLSVSLAYDDDPHHISGTITLRASRERSIMFQKEALLNEVLRRCCGTDYDSVAWVDADVIFANPRWAYDAQRALELFDIVQLFGRASLLDHQGEEQWGAPSCGSRFAIGDPKWADLRVNHPGFAWAARTAVIRNSGLFPHAVTGCGDTLMLHGFCGMSGSLTEAASVIGPACLKALSRWTDKLSTHRGLKIGYVPGQLLHMYHGSIAGRKNVDRRPWLAEVDPARDLVTREDGVLEWSDFAMKNKQRLVQGLRRYFEERKEDGP